MHKDVVPMRILVVEDDEDCAELLSELFLDRGHRVEVCRDGSLALDAMTRFQPQVAMLDVGLPDMTGYQLARKVRALPLPESKVWLIALTGYSGDAERRLADDAGFDAHFVKPVHPDVLVRAVENSPRSS